MDGATLTCPDCGADMALRDVRGMDPFYGCTRFPDCRGTHGAHPDGRPLGIPADAATRAARIVAHEAFDALWEGALEMYDTETRLQGWAKGARDSDFLLRLARQRAYAWLGWRLGMSAGECHMGKLDAFHCELVVAACDGVTPEDVRAWAKDKRYSERVAKLLRFRERDLKRHLKKVDAVVRKYGAEQVEAELVDVDHQFDDLRSHTLRILKRDMKP